MKVKESATWFAVRIEGVKGPGFAIGPHSTRALFLTRTEAQKWCDDLQEHLESKCKVVVVSVTITEK
jgi:hypothetical protein